MAGGESLTSGNHSSINGWLSIAMFDSQKVSSHQEECSVINRFWLQVVDRTMQQTNPCSEGERKRHRDWETVSFNITCITSKCNPYSILNRFDFPLPVVSWLTPRPMQNIARTTVPMYQLLGIHMSEWKSSKTIWIIWIIWNPKTWKNLECLMVQSHFLVELRKLLAG